jgi:hypothetical protein
VEAGSKRKVLTLCEGPSWELEYCRDRTKAVPYILEDSMLNDTFFRCVLPGKTSNFISFKCVFPVN